MLNIKCFRWLNPKVYHTAQKIQKCCNYNLDDNCLKLTTLIIIYKTKKAKLKLIFPKVVLLCPVILD